MRPLLRRRVHNTSRVIPDDTPPKPKNLEDAAEYLAYIGDAIANGRMDARTGHEASFALKGFLEAAAKRDTAKRVAELKAFVRDMKKCPACATLWTMIEADE